MVGSQLLFNAALQPRIKVCATARPLFLGQLHGAEIGRSYMAQVSERFCRDTGRDLPDRTLLKKIKLHV